MEKFQKAILIQTFEVIGSNHLNKNHSLQNFSIFTPTVEYYHATLKLNNHELRKLITLNDNVIEIFSKVNKKNLKFFFSK